MAAKRVTHDQHSRRRTSMVTKIDLPPGFDPENYVRKTGTQDEMKGAANLVQYDPKTGFHLFSKMERAAGGNVVTRCWHCYSRPDGSYDCFEVACPWNVVLVAQ
jgi:hypothetical protein